MWLRSLLNVSGVNLAGIDAKAEQDSRLISRLWTNRDHCREACTVKQCVMTNGCFEDDGWVEHLQSWIQERVSELWSHQDLFGSFIDSCRSCKLCAGCIECRKIHHTHTHTHTHTENLTLITSIRTYCLVFSLFFLSLSLSLPVLLVRKSYFTRHIVTPPKIILWL